VEIERFPERDIHDSVLLADADIKRQQQAFMSAFSGTQRVPSKISRKRTVTSRKPVKQRATCSSQSKLKDSQYFVGLFPESNLRANTCTSDPLGLVLCQACPAVLSRRKSVIRDHLKCKAHQLALQQQASNREKQTLIDLAWKSLDKTLPQTSLKPDEFQHRIEIVRAFLRSGTPLSRIRYFAALFNKSGFLLLVESNCRS